MPYLRFLGLTVLICLPGCKSFEPALFNHGDGLRSQTVLVVPFAEIHQDRWYLESIRGAQLARNLQKWAARNGDADFMDTGDARPILNAIRDWTESAITRRDWQKLLAGAEVDYVVVGDILEWRPRSDRTIGLLDASIRAHYRVLDGATGREKYFGITNLQLGGLDDDADIPMLEMGSHQQKVEERLLVGLARKIGQELYGYYRH